MTTLFRPPPPELTGTHLTQPILWPSNGSFFPHDDRPESALVIWQETNLLGGANQEVEWNVLRADLGTIFHLFKANGQNAAEAW